MLSLTALKATCEVHTLYIVYRAMAAWRQKQWKFKNTAPKCPKKEVTKLHIV